mgnify:CR=1 FL=1
MKGILSDNLGFRTGQPRTTVAGSPLMNLLFALECKPNVKGGITCLKLTLSKVCFFTFKEVSVFSSKVGIGLLRR